MNQMGNLGGSVEKKSHGPLIAVVIILFLIIIGGLYFLGQRMSSKSYQNLQQNGQTDSQIQNLQQQSSSDDPNAINADLKATNVNNLDQGAAAFEADMAATSTQ